MSEIETLAKGEVSTPAEKRKAAKINERQRELLLSFKHSHEEGKKSPPYYVPFGMTGLSLGGAGQAMSGLLKRGMVQERNNLYYITDAGIAALD